MIKFLFLFITSVYPSFNTQSFNVEFVGLNAAHVNISTADTIYNNNKSKSITFRASSSNFMNYIFEVENYYHTITTEDFKNILYFNKETSQPRVNNKINTSIINNTVMYDNSNIKIPNNTFNIFSLLIFLSYNKLNEKTIIKVEREGALYNGKSWVSTKSAKRT